MTRITIEIPDYIEGLLSGADANDLEIVLRDALYEFESHRERGNAEAYVNKRYPLMGYVDGNWQAIESAYPEGPRRDAKIDQVKRRFRWAEALRSGRIAQIEALDKVDQDVDPDDFDPITNRSKRYGRMD
jgi:hypothetical protein